MLEFNRQLISASNGKILCNVQDVHSDMAAERESQNFRIYSLTIYGEGEEKVIVKHSLCLISCQFAANICYHTDKL